MNHEVTSTDRAMRLLACIRERTEHIRDPAFVAALAADCRMSTPEAAWRYLRDHGLIDTFSIPYTARINPAHGGSKYLLMQRWAHCGYSQYETAGPPTMLRA